LEHLVATPVRGAATASPGVTLAVRSDLALCSVMARKDSFDALTRRVRQAFGLALPSTPRHVAAAAVAFAWAGPDAWLVSAQGMSGHALEQRLRRELGGLVSIADQSDGRTVIRVAGPRAREALAKGVPIDLHPRAFVAGDTALITVAHIGVQVWQLDDAPTYELAVFRSFAVAFWHWLADASAEFGVAVADGA
jgi:sarcosine oxidase subunit gamma